MVTFSKTLNYIHKLVSEPKGSILKFNGLSNIHIVKFDFGYLFSHRTAFKTHKMHSQTTQFSKFPRRGMPPLYAILVNDTSPFLSIHAGSTNHSVSLSINRSNDHVSQPISESTNQSFTWWIPSCASLHRRSQDFSNGGGHSVSKGKVLTRLSCRPPRRIFY